MIRIGILPPPVKRPMQPMKDPSEEDPQNLYAGPQIKWGGPAILCDFPTRFEPSPDSTPVICDFPTRENGDTQIQYYHERSQA